MPQASLINVGIATAMLCAASGTLYLRFKYARLACAVSHRRISASERSSYGDQYSIQSLPEELISHPEEYHLIHDRDSIFFTYKVSRDNDPISNQDEVVTHLLRRNMLYFSRWTIQGWSLWLLSRRFPENVLSTKSFTSDHISRLYFQPGEIVCGVYQVLSRSDGHPQVVELGMRQPPGMEGLDGRLVVRLDLNVDVESSFQTSTKRATLTTETLQWTRRREIAQPILPLDRSLLRYLHEIACWTLLVTGANFLREKLEVTSPSPL